jgi:hypothetical protein
MKMFLVFACFRCLAKKCFSRLHRFALQAQRRWKKAGWNGLPSYESSAERHCRQQRRQGDDDGVDDGGGGDANEWGIELVVDASGENSGLLSDEGVGGSNVVSVTNTDAVGAVDDGNVDCGAVAVSEDDVAALMATLRAVNVAGASNAPSQSSREEKDS